ncbi:hypothetical protein PINS_up013454 [Pythium insidiosum]|nr:hypothetical protein PINS_up013454 [Pythium insidiosum]
MLKPKLSRKEVVEVVESEHPYAGGEDIRHPLVFYGASEIVIYFDKMSSIAGPNDYVTFLKRDDDGRSKSHPESSNGVPYWGEEKYFGDAFPGVGDNPPLRIPAAAVDVCFHADANIGVARSEWGFKLTAHAYEETLVYPPERPPTISVGAINDLRARATKALSALTRVLRKNDMSSLLLPVMAHITRVANQPCNGRPTQSTPKRQDFESKHPYSNSVMEYMVVTFSGASRLVITFDARSRTEFATDYLCFYKDKALADRWGEYQYSGSDDRANWPGTGGRPPLIIPSDSFTLLWCTDATNVDWGWKFTVVAEFPSVLPLELRIDQLEKRAWDLWEIMFEGTEYQRDPPAHEYDGFEQFDSLAEANAYRSQNDHLRKATGLLSVPSERPAIKARERDLGVFRVLRDEGITVHQQPHVSASIVKKLGKGEEFRVVNQSNGWLELAASEPTHESCGWVLHRANDDLFVVSAEYCAHNEDLIVLGVDDVVSSLQNITFAMDNSNPEHDAMTKFVSQFSFESLKGQLSRLQSLAYDTHRALTIKYAREVLLLYMTAATNAPLSLSIFSTVDDFFMLLAHFQDQETMEDGSLTSDALEKRVMELLRPLPEVEPSSTVSLKQIVDKCVAVLSKAQYLLPRTRGALRVIESMHPYLDDLDQYWQVSIPGAKSIRIYFDPRSKTEAGCDWVCFYKEGSKRGETYGESQYSGRTGSENWPGCGGRPPLIIEASTVEVHFHSDSSQNDWGFKLYAVGVFDDAEDIVSEAEQIRATVRLAKMSVWLLKLAAQAAPHTISSPVFSASVLEALHQCLMNHPQQVKICALELLGLLAQRHGFLQTIPIEVVERIHHTLISKLRAQALTEDRSDTKSEYFQALVQCAVLVDLGVDSNKFPFQLSGDTSMLNFTPVPLNPTTVGASSSFIGYIPILERSTPHHLEVLMQTLSGDMDIILSQGSAQHPRQILRWSSSGSVWVVGQDSMAAYSPYRKGDLLTLYVDFGHQYVALRKNRQLVCEITSQSHGSLISWQTLIKEETASSGWNIVSSLNSNIVLSRRVPGSTLALVPTPITPNWYNKVCDAVSMLLDFHEGRVSAIKVLESHHPISNADVHTPRAVVQIKDAVALEIRFDRQTALSDKHQLVFTGCKDRRKVCLTDLGETDERSALYVPDLSKRSWLVKVGDQVVRAADWQYGDEDGGAGSRGTVVAVTSWAGRNGCGVRVLWEATSKEDIYRYGYDGFFDVQPFVSPRKLPDVPLLFEGDSVEFSIEADCDDSSKRHPVQGVDAYGGALHLQPGNYLQLSVAKHRRLLTDDYTFEMWIAPTVLPSSSTRLDIVSGTDFRHLKQSLGDSQGRAMTTVFRLVAADEVGGIDVVTDINGVIHVIPSLTTFDQDTMLSETSRHTSGLHLGEWNHLAVVISSLRYTVFVNGISVCDGGTHLESLRGVLASKLIVGSKDSSRTGFISFHISDFKVWDVPLRMDQLQGHANGLDTVNHNASYTSGFSGPSSQPSSPRTPRRLTASNAFPPPSPARSPSRNLNTLSPHAKKWITANRAGRDNVHVRADCCIPVEGDPNDVYYFEAHVLSGGKVCIGWVSTSSTLPHRDCVIGETAKSFGLELPQRKVHVDGKTIDVDVSSPRNGSISPRRSSTSTSSFTNDVFAREGDILGCAISMSKRKLWYFLNGELIVAITLELLMENEPIHRQASSAPSDEQQEFDSLVGEMLSMGFSRTVSEDVVDASGARSVPGALNWLLEETIKSGEAPSPRRFSSASPMSSPRRRFSSASEPSVRRLAVRDPLTEAVYPAASLGAQGAQGVAWNLGQRPFRFTPDLDSRNVVSVLEKTRRSEDSVKFEVFDQASGHWEHVSYRHRVQDIAPTLLAWWKLDEGEGTTVHDAADSQHGTIQGDNDNLSKLWDDECLAPLTVRKLRWAAVEPIVPPVATKKVAPAMWGYRCFVIPHFSASTIGRTRFGTSAPSLVDGKVVIKSRQDQQFVKYINKSITAKQLSLPQALRATWNEISPSDDELLQWPVLVDIASGGSMDKAEEDGQKDTAPVSRLHGGMKGASANEHLAKRFRILQDFNSAISRLLPFIPFDAPSITHCSGVASAGTEHVTLSQLVTAQRIRIFNIVKRHVWDDALKRTTEAGVAFELSLNRVKAMRHRLAGKPDDEGRSALFSQAFRQLSALDGAHFRRSDAIYYVRFLGENAEDAGGPYRETFAQYSEELHSSQLSILLPSSNAHHNVGSGREKWVLNPGATSRTHLQMVEFLGKLMGVAARSRQYISLHIASLIWKKLVGEVATVDDLSLVDSMIVNSLKKIRDIDQFGVTEEMFEDIVMETFTTLSADNRVVQLKSNGESIAVTFANRKEYADLVERYRLHEFDVQIAALLSGLAKVIPARLLPLFTGTELEILVCGSPEIDVDLLQRCTEYSSCSASDQHIIWFWEVLREFTHEERSAFLRFVWGRSRLPANEKEFPQLFKLQSFNKQQPGQPADAYLPIAHTCFFAVEMPIYSSIDVLRQKLLYAIYNCQEIDADGDSVAANQLGWEE